jgi:uncharacterized damage-inducible protein DinB
MGESGETNVTLGILTEGWAGYQTKLIDALGPLSPEQLAHRAAPALRSIDELARHIIGVRAGWFHNILGEGDDAFGAYHDWDQPDAPARTAHELVRGLAATWEAMQAALARFTPDDLVAMVTGERKGRTFAYRRGWVVWHVLEHDLHHSGELGYSLGMQGLQALDL